MKYGIWPLRPVDRWRVTVLGNTGIEGLELSPRALRNGRNSGCAAINLAVHFGAVRVLLLGYDMGGSHWFGQHPQKLRSNPPYESYIAAFATLVEPLHRIGVTVINCSRRTNLTTFRRAPLAESLSFHMVSA